MSNRRRLPILATVAASLLLMVSSTLPSTADEVYGPVNLLKTMRTPFSTQSEGGQASNQQLAPMSLHSALSHSLSNRLLPPRIYLPGRMVIGSTAEFIIKGRPGSWVALAMADRNTGAKPISGHDIHLGADRKLVSLGKIPDTGVLSLVIDTPIQGDLIGQPLYFEAVVWTKDDFSDLEVAAPVPSESTAAKPGVRDNGVLVAAEAEKKRGLRIVPDASMNLQSVQGSTPIDSGRP